LIGWSIDLNDLQVDVPAKEELGMQFYNSLGNLDT
jgi:hypothetical protein